MSNTVMSFRYKIELIYLDIKNNYIKKITNDCLKSMIIDHNYDSNNCMPVIYLNLSLDKSFVDNIILNKNTNLFTLVLYKYDELADTILETECFRKKCVYFLPDDVSNTDSIDYNETNIEQNIENTFRQINLGLICLDHINNNKRSLEIAAGNASVYDCAKYCTSHIPNMIIEPFSYNEHYNQIIMPTKDSVNKALKFLNNFRVFYSTPYRYYQDFNYTYIISSSGKAIRRKDEKYSSIIINIQDILAVDANDPGISINKERQSYEIVVNYINASVSDNTLVNKSKNKLKGITSSGVDLKTLKNNASYYTEKIESIRLNNDNTNMLDNIEYDYNSSNAFVSIIKSNLDTDIFSINKRYTINHIERYQKLNGEYLLSRKREIYIREDETFIMDSILNFRKID